MGITKPYCRLWRPLKGYGVFNRMFSNGEPAVTTEYLDDERFACQAEMESLVTTAHLIVRDLYEIFDFVEPCDANVAAYSHRIYELFLRTATEFESNCKGILNANGYVKARMNAEDYFKIAAAARISGYEVRITRWATDHVFKPFASWNGAVYAPLAWYQDYNLVKHNRYANFSKANFGNLMNAVAGLLCILYVQIGGEMDRACFEGFSTSQSDQQKVSNGTFTIHAPQFPEAEQYEFIWDNIKLQPDAVHKYNF